MSVKAKNIISLEEKESFAEMIRVRQMQKRIQNTKLSAKTHRTKLFKNLTF